MRNLIRALRPALVCFAVLTVVCGVAYPGIVTGIAQTLFHDRANGSTVTVTYPDGEERVCGSALIAQEFTKPEYLIGRPMGTTNLSPVSAEQETLVAERVAFLRSIDPDNPADIPMDLVTASGSGVDPNISPAAAEYQVARIARTRGMSEEDVRAIVKRYTTGRFLGLWGEPAVNVLKVNLALDGLLWQ